MCRFTAPAGGDEGDKAKDKAERAQDQAGDASRSVSAAAREAKDSVVSGANYVADRCFAGYLVCAGPAGNLQQQLLLLL